MRRPQAAVFWRIGGAVRRKECRSMVQAKWGKTLLVVLACVGLSRGQQPPAAAPAGTPLGVMAVPELGKDKRGQEKRAEVLRSWHQPDGKTIFELRDLETNQRIIVIEDPAGSGAKQRSLFAWGQDNQMHPIYAPVPTPIDQMSAYRPPQSPTVVAPQPPTVVAPPTAFETPARKRGLFSRNHDKAAETFVSSAPVPMPMTPAAPAYAEAMPPPAPMTGGV